MCRCWEEKPQSLISEATASSAGQHNASPWWKVHPSLGNKGPQSRHPSTHTLYRLLGTLPGSSPLEFSLSLQIRSPASRLPQLQTKQFTQSPCPDHSKGTDLHHPAEQLQGLLCLCPSLPLRWGSGLGFTKPMGSLKSSPGQRTPLLQR